MERIVDWAWASSLVIDPVASMQKHTSIKPKAGIGKWSFDFVLNTVFLMFEGTTFVVTGLIADLDLFFFDDFFDGTDLEVVLLLSLAGTAFLEALVFLIFFCFLELLPVSGFAD